MEREPDPFDTVRLMVCTDQHTDCEKRVPVAIDGATL
jgi:hypothetical protein